MWGKKNEQVSYGDYVIALDRILTFQKDYGHIEIMNNCICLTGKNVWRTDVNTITLNVNDVVKDIPISNNCRQFANQLVRSNICSKVLMCQQTDGKFVGFDDHYIAFGKRKIGEHKIFFSVDPTFGIRNIDTKIFGGGTYKSIIIFENSIQSMKRTLNKLYGGEFSIIL